jgi:TPR repeat protein
MIGQRILMKRFLLRSWLGAIGSRSAICLFFGAILFMSACATRPSHDELEMQWGRYYFDTQQYTLALKMLEPLAARGNPEAQYAMGYMYYYGLGTHLDTQTAKVWFHMAAVQGCVKAMHALEMMPPPPKEPPLWIRDHDPKGYIFKQPNNNYY